jgi:uncharacterized coiled-coil DUF342 family protein
MNISNIKDDYTRKMHSKLDQWGAEIDALSAKADQAEAQARVEYHKQIAALHSKKDEARNRLTELENASESAWGDMKSGVEAVWDSVGEAVNSAKSRFK